MDTTKNQILGDRLAFFKSLAKVFYFYGSTVTSKRCSESKRFKRLSSIVVFLLVLLYSDC